jgi:hypothetical protein
MTRFAAFAATLSLALLASACTSSTDDATIEDESEDLSGSPAAIDIGFNGGPDQFDYYADFQKLDVGKGARLCHTYVSWTVGEDTAGMGDKNSTSGTRAYLEYWLHQAQGHCDEALISFKSRTHGAAPGSARYEKAFEAFLAVDWKGETGFTGAISVTPWNEPNNEFDAGNGLGVVIEPELAARYYLAAESKCRAKGCRVAAGDFASNGDWWKDFSWNCADDNVAPSDLCKQKSPRNADNEQASYLDRYKNTIANEAQKYGLPKDFRPKYFAYHGWHDENDYMNDANHCSTYEDCGVRRLVTSLGGSWGGVEIWDTEVGVSQDQPTPVPEDEFACGAAFLLRLHAKVSRRITRIYYTRMHGGSGELLVGHTPRDGAKILAKRETTVPGARCK